MDMTPHKWQKAGDTFVFALNEDGVNEFDFFVQAKDKEKAKQVATLACAAPALLEALELARQFIANGIELGYIKMPDQDTPDSAHKTLPLIDAAIAAAKGGGEMKIGIDGNMWYCSNGLDLPDRNAKFTFERTLRQAVTKYNEEFKCQESIPERLIKYADQTPEEYKLQIRSHV